MMWFRDVVGLVIKGLLFGVLLASICCYEGLRGVVHIDEPRSDVQSLRDSGSSLAIPVFRATCLGIVAILIVNLSWFVLVYHAVPFYGPTLLKPPGS
jgi:phospholipid/cholesterol/gamma-HCH transport system permease protein